MRRDWRQPLADAAQIACRWLSHVPEPAADLRHRGDPEVGLVREEVILGLNRHHFLDGYETTATGVNLVRGGRIRAAASSPIQTAMTGRNERKFLATLGT